MADFQAEPGPTQFEAGFGFVGSQMLVSAQDNLTASTTQTIAGATQIASMQARFTTVANAGDAAKLPPGVKGMNIAVINSGAQNMAVLGFQSGDTINGIAGSTGLSQMPNSTVYYACTSVSATGNAVWTAQDIGCGAAGNFPLLAYQDNLTASTTQSAAGGTPITSSTANFLTVANNNDAATLPPAKPGMAITVLSNGAQTLKVFSATNALGGVAAGDKINSNATFLTITSGSITIFYCTALGQWYTK